MFLGYKKRSYKMGKKRANIYCIIVLYWVIVIDFARDHGLLRDFWDSEIFSVDNQKIDFYTILLFLMTTILG